MSEKRALVVKRQKAKEREEKKRAKAVKEADKAKAKERSKKSSKAEQQISQLLLKGDFLQIFPNARRYSTILTKKFVNRPTWRRPDPQEIKSIIPGVVISFEVKEGDRVTAGTHLMTFEAMKMHNLVIAPFDGTVEKLFVKEGEKVPKGVVMMFLKADTEPEPIVSDESTSSDLGLIV